MASLYDITGRALMLLSMADDADIEEDVLKDTLEGIEGEYDDKIEAYCKVVKNLEADAKAIAEEMKRLQAKRKYLENNIDRMKKTMFDSLKLMEKTSAGGKILKASIQKNGGKAPLVFDVDEEDVPIEFQKVSVEPNNEVIREALDNGVELNFVHYGERGESLRIK